ncbi:hypothetical protein CARUB_v10007882mg [Capsella rubella]|uniref:Uncharacterized protein n=1 Tax=Capsella rubella TaxID=81985 RepID=R0H6L2_9BRAS|nr:hypothetical protein CARUB_v10007882mg [Capsella rubella]
MRASCLKVPRLLLYLMLRYSINLSFSRSKMLKRILEELLKEAHPNIEFTVIAHESWKDEILKQKAFAVLDDLDKASSLSQRAISNCSRIYSRILM